LDAAGITERVLDTGATTLLWWWLEEENAFAALNTLLATEGPGAACYEDAQGRVIFKSRHARWTESRSLTSQGTINATTVGQIMADGPIRYDDGIKDVVNEVSLEAWTRAVQAYAAIWTLGSGLILGSGETRRFRIKASGGDPFLNAIVPTAGTDYTVSSGTVVDVQLDRLSGASAVLSITAGAGGATVAGLQVRAQAVTATNKTAIDNTVDASASIAEHGVKTFRPALRKEIEVNFAQDLANAIVQWYQNGRPAAHPVVFAGYDATAKAAAYQREVGDRVTIVDTVIGINGAYWIEAIEHHIDQPSASIHKTTFGCEAVPSTTGAFIVGTSALGSTSDLVWF
jgi:hypothetical protein